MFNNFIIFSKKIILFLPLLFLISCDSPQKETIFKEEADTVTLPYYNSPDFKPYWFNNKAELQKNITHQLGKFSFLNQNAETITEKVVEGKIHVANFFFTTCQSICPVMIYEFERLQTSFIKDKDVVLLSFSVDPRNDTLETLKAYANLHHLIKDKWHLLTGNKQELYALGRTFYFAEKEEGYAKKSDQFLHTENFILVDKRGYIRGIYNGTLSEETDRLINDIRNLMKEKL